MVNPYWVVGLLYLVRLTLPVYAANLSVGPGQRYVRIEDAVKNAGEGDTILVYPQVNNHPYLQVALYIDKPKLTIKAVRKHRLQRIPLNGRGYDYSGRGKVPRAIVQFSSGSDGSSLEGFELYEAHNKTRNGSGIRIDRANDITVSDCTVHHNDMGIMSNGDGTPYKGVNQRIEGSLIYANGDLNQPGFSHNLYLGGSSASVIGSEIHSSLTGHNLKSRVHKMVVMACYIHDSANRELDLVDAAGDTDAPHSDVVLAGNIIEKSATGTGNRQVIHFGRDGRSQRNGRLYLIHNNIITPFGAAVLRISSSAAQVRMFNNIVWDSSGLGKKQRLAEIVSSRNKHEVISGAGNWFSSGFAGPQLNKFNLRSSFVAPYLLMPSWADYSNHDFALHTNDQSLVGRGVVLPAETLNVMGSKLHYFHSGQQTYERQDNHSPTIGAFPFESL